MESCVDSSSSVGWSLSKEPLADAQRIVDTVHEPRLGVGDDLQVKHVNPASYEVYAPGRETTLGPSVFEVGDGRFDQPGLRDALKALLEEDRSFERAENDRIFGALGCRVIQINGRTLRDDAEENMFKSYDEHANAYVPKPVDLGEITTIVQSIDEIWFQVVCLSGEGG